MARKVLTVAVLFIACASNVQAQISALNALGIGGLGNGGIGGYQSGIGGLVNRALGGNTFGGNSFGRGNVFGNNFGSGSTFGGGSSIGGGAGFGNGFSGGSNSIGGSPFDNSFGNNIRNNNNNIRNNNNNGIQSTGYHHSTSRNMQTGDDFGNAGFGDNTFDPAFPAPSGDFFAGSGAGFPSSGGSFGGPSDGFGTSGSNGFSSGSGGFNSNSIMPAEIEEGKVDGNKITVFITGGNPAPSEYIWTVEQPNAANQFKNVKAGEDGAGKPRAVNRGMFDRGVEVVLRLPEHSSTPRTVTLKVIGEGNSWTVSREFNVPASGGLNRRKNVARQERTTVPLETTPFN